MARTVAPLERLRAICLAFPEVTERPSHGAPSWFVRDKSTFVTFWEHGHHDLEFPHLWLAAPRVSARSELASPAVANEKASTGAQAELMAADPDRFFRPPYVGHRGWVGVRMDRRIDWAEIAELCEDAYRVVAPRRLVEALNSRGPEGAGSG